MNRKDVIDKLVYILNMNDVHEMKQAIHLLIRYLKDLSVEVE